MANETKKVLGVDIGGTKIAICIADTNGEIVASDLGISPVSDGRVIRLPIPELSEERRKDMTKLVKKRSEEARVEIRNARRDANDAIKKAQKASEITEDEMKSKTDEVQKMTDKMIEQVNKILEDKEKELMMV